MMTKKESTKIVNLMTPREGFFVLGRNHVSYKVKMHIFFKNLFLYSRVWFRQSKCIVMMTKESSTKIIPMLVLLNKGMRTLVFTADPCKYLICELTRKVNIVLNHVLRNFEHVWDLVYNKNRIFCKALILI